MKELTQRRRSAPRASCHRGLPASPAGGGERGRAEAREGRRGLPAEREDRWSSVAQKATRRGRWPAIAPPPGRAWPRCAGGARTRCVSSCEPCGSRWASPGSPGQLGGLRRQVSTAPHRVGQAYRQRLASQPSTLRTRRKRRCAGRAAVQRPSRGTPGQGTLLSTGMRSGASCNMRSTTLKHPRASGAHLLPQTCVKTLNHALGAVFKRR